MKEKQLMESRKGRYKISGGVILRAGLNIIYQDLFPVTLVKENPVSDMPEMILCSG